MYRIIATLGILMASTSAANALDYYAAIAFSPTTGNTGWSYGYSSQESRKPWPCRNATPRTPESQ